MKAVKLWMICFWAREQNCSRLQSILFSCFCVSNPMEARDLTCLQEPCAKQCIYAVRSQSHVLKHFCFVFGWAGKGHLLHNSINMHMNSRWKWARARRVEDLWFLMRGEQSCPNGWVISEATDGWAPFWECCILCHLDAIWPVPYQTNFQLYKPLNPRNIELCVQCTEYCLTWDLTGNTVSYNIISNMTDIAVYFLFSFSLQDCLHQNMPVSYWYISTH